MAQEPSRTTETDADVGVFVAGIEHPVRQRDARRMIALMTRATGLPPRMWGPSIVGFGTYHYRYETGREGDMAAAAFSPRKAATTVYLHGVAQRPELLEALGPHTTGKGCLYLKNLDAVDLGVLETLVRQCVEGLDVHEPQDS
jgi:uncharacterized protein DUF1801